ncbi:hypothetical protein SY27_00820 [Flavobacterium sp. 316]|uniref:Tetratricopeptide repeat protein n=1 Tax=Flavobacterium sediminilitoris TaxID=2024526 RepID=A0ABY4HPA5_9FLAO|nr:MULTISPECIES: tetratricopeptide repeat protein [Flavobacterium]KIX22428.1 hypothetical protein SY27_00820 [Flavobacterium sp. 316]UOX33634.1 tetratricopeptide repeat protein [Flavobacterium sediminilitoris]
MSKLYYFIVLLLLPNSALIFAQESVDYDKMLRSGTLLIYDNPDSAIIKGQKIVKESKNIDIQIQGLKLISDAYSSKRDYEKSLEYVIKATHLLSKSKNKLLKIKVIVKTGIQYHQLKIYDKALQYLDEGEQLSLQYPIKDSIYSSLGINYAVRGFIYKEKFNCDIAIDYFNKSLESFNKIKTKTVIANISIVQYNKGNCYLLSFDLESAKQNFNKAIKEASSIKANSLEAFALKGLAQAYTLEAKYNEAITTLERALLISSEVNDLILNQEIYKGLSNNYLAINNKEEFNKFHTKYLNTQNLIKLSERKSISDSLIEKKVETNSQLNTQVSKYYFFIFIALIFLFLSFIVFIIIRKKQKKEAKNLKKRIQSLQNEK